MHKITYQQYAQAIYSLAKKENIVSQIIDDLETVDKRLNESPSFLKHLSYHKLTLAEKTKNLEDVFSDFISKRTYKILILLIKNKHLDWLDKIIGKIERLKKDDENILEAKIVIPLALNENQKAKIKSILELKIQKQIIIDEIIDKKIIGGIKIYLGGLIIDSSIAGRIEKLKTSISTI